MNIQLPVPPLATLTAGEVIKSLHTAPVANLADLTRGRPILIIAPHSDDETLGCGGLIALCAAAGIDVTVAIMTDGARSHLNSVKFNADMRRTMRENEVRSALDALSAHNAKLIYFREPDGYLESSGPASDKILSSLDSLIRHSNCGSVFVTWGADPHPDHTASYMLVEKLSHSCKDVLFFAYPIWAFTLPHETTLKSPLEHPVRLEIRQVKNQKRRAIECFATQISNLIDDDPEGFRLTPEHINLFCSDFEFFIEFAHQQSLKTVRVSSVPTEHFEKLYEKSLDPWNYKTNTYEQNRFDVTLKSLPRKEYRNGCEIGCSIGILTKKLAAICTKMTGIDCSAKALEQAKKNVSNIDNIQLKLMRVPEELPTETYDLIVLSEVLYFFSDNDLKVISDFVIKKLDYDGTCLLVNFLGDTESPMSGNEVAIRFSDLTFQDLKILSTKEYEGFRIDVLVKTDKFKKSEAENVK